MTNLELITKLRSHKGRVMAGVLGNDDVRYLRVYKNDLIDDLSRMPNEESSYRVSYGYGDLFIDPTN